MQNNIRKYRTQTKYSQKDLSKESGINTATISALENQSQDAMWQTQRKLFQALIKLGATKDDGSELEIKDVFPTVEVTS